MYGRQTVHTVLTAAFVVIYIIHVLCHGLVQALKGCVRNLVFVIYFYKLCTQTGPEPWCNKCKGVDHTFVRVSASVAAFLLGSGAIPLWHHSTAIKHSVY